MLCLVLSFSSVKREGDQNAARLFVYIFNKDESTNSIQKRENPKQPYLFLSLFAPITHETLKEYGCLNMVPNQRQRKTPASD